MFAAKCLRARAQAADLWEKRDRELMRGRLVSRRTPSVVILRSPEYIVDSGFGQAEQRTLNSQLFSRGPRPESEKAKKINWLGEEDSNLH